MIVPVVSWHRMTAYVQREGPGGLRLAEQSKDQTVRA